MKIEMRKTAEIIPYERNPRINDAAVDAVAHSIKEFGWRQPIVVDAEGVIICGHTRWKAAQKLGLDKVPVHVATDLTPTQVKAYRIADNKLAELAEWNMELLPIELAELKEAGVDMTLLGFSLDELNLQQGQTDPDNVPSPPDKATSAKGEIYQLGKHRLMCGDSGSVADLDLLLAGQPIHLANTDPPYNVKVEPRSNNAIAAGLSSFEGLKHHQRFDLERGKVLRRSRLQETVDALDAKGHHHAAMKLAGGSRPGLLNRVSKKMRPKDRPLENDFVSDDAFEKMLQAWFGNIARVLLPGRSFYIWGGLRTRAT